MKNKKFSLNNLFYNNRFVLVFSLVAAVLVWIVSGLQYSPEDERTIENVPVTIELSQAMQDFGLKSFGDADYTVDVKVKGKRYLVSPKALSADGITVKANTKYVDSAGRYTLALSASAAENGAEFDIVSISMAYVDVFFDVEKTAEFTIETDLNAPNGVVPEGYYSSTPMLSQKTVKITGPETEVNKITGVVCSFTLDAPITETETYDCTLKAVSAAGVEPDYLVYSSTESGMTLTVPVYRVETLNAGVSFINSPVNYIKTPFTYKVSPASATFAVTENKLDGLNGIFNILTVDFNQLSPGENIFVVDSIPTESGLLLDENVKQFTVTVYVNDVVEKNISVPLSAVEFTGGDQLNPVTDGNAFVKVNVVGPSASLKNITAESITLKCDLSGYAEGEGTVNAPVAVSVGDADDCWICGSYSVNVTV